ncbi:MAG: hypothetical protein HXX16_07145 [Bacteroidales bacterium]|nr:hypothetical protein [Bacteroidales bacterium]
MNTEKLNLETEQRIAKIVNQFEKGEIKQEQLEKILGGLQNNKQDNKIDFSDFLSGAHVI